MATDEEIDEVDEAALAMYGDDSPEVVAFWRAWEAWGIWANGGFESVFTGGLADDLPAVIAAFEEVGVPAMAELFRSAGALLPVDVVASFDARTAFFEIVTPAARAVLQEWTELDDRMEALPTVNHRLWELLEERKEPRDPS